MVCKIPIFMDYTHRINSSYSSKYPSISSLPHHLSSSHIPSWINWSTFLVLSWPFHFPYWIYQKLSLIFLSLPYLAVFASSTYDWAWNSGCSHGLLREQALYEDVMTRRISQGVVRSWLCACSRDAASFQIPVRVIVLFLLPGTEIKFKITAPTGGTWKTFPRLW